MMENRDSEVSLWMKAKRALKESRQEMTRMRMRMKMEMKQPKNSQAKEILDAQKKKVMKKVMKKVFDPKKQTTISSEKLSKGDQD